MGRTLCLVVYLASLAISTDGHSTSANSTANVGSSHPVHSKCSLEEFQCTNGDCIPQEKLCNTEKDCADASDELGCCGNPERYFSCRWSRRCIHHSLRCDGYDDCGDGSDEECSQKPRDCGKHSVACDGGKKCIPKKWLCDREVDCQDGSDEADCKELTCQPHNFQCKNGECMPPNFVCDGEKDCRDGSDELNCDSIGKCDASARKMQCDTKLHCVPLEAACNKNPDCVDGSDEGGDCDKPTCDNYCSHKCFKTPKGAVCVCPPSYSLNPDGRTCSDIDECQSNWSVCGHFCNNKEGGYTCTCAKGYVLQEDNATCLTTIPGHSFIIMSIGNDVRYLDLQDSVYDILHHGKEQVQGVSYDPVDDMVYWHNSRNVYRKSRKSDGLAEVILSGLGTLGGIAVDWYGRNLYLTDKVGQSIVVCSFDAACLPLVKEGVERPCEIRIDPVSRYMFWTDIVNKQIERAGLDGSDRKVLVKREVGCPSGLALDTAARRVYWFNANKDTAEHVDYDGGNLKHLPEAAIERPYSLSVWEDMVYWSDLHKQAVMAANKRTGKNKTELIKLDNNEAHGIYVYHPALNEQVFNPCGASVCSHLCLLSPGTLGFTCNCPSGMTILDGRNCKGNVGQNHLMLGVKGQLGTLQQQHYGSRVVEWKSNIQLVRCSDIDYDPVQDRIIISDVWANKIFSINLTTRLMTTLVNDVRYPVGVAVDWVLGNIYWVDGFKHMVEATNSSGQIWTIILPSIYHPKDIAVAPIEGFLYVVVAGYDPRITRCRLDGSNCMKILEDYVQKPQAIVVDHNPSNRRIYWTDSEANKICSANLDGSNKIDVVTKLDHPVDLAIFGKQIFWSQHRSNNLYSVAKSGNISSVTKYSIGDGRRISVVSEWPIALADIGWKLSPKGHAAVNPCKIENGGCQHLCFVGTTRDKVCKCGIGYELMSDGVSCDKKNKCSNEQFECVSTGLCIDKSWKCDGTKDCDDGSDEECHNQCDPEEFRCNNGGCIEASKKCDTYEDCGDESDESEETCGPKTCSAGKWQCASLQCIPKEWRCDGVNDCKDKSDEDDCHHVCPKGKFNCGDGRCIQMDWQCDGSEDCSDGTDEVGCEPITCHPNDFACANGKCISKSLQCDGKDQCGDNSDEDERSNCTRSDCPSHTFKCTSVSDDSVPACLPHTALCDGKQDCFNSEDEKNCSNSCSLDEFSCPNSSRCIPSRWICNGEQDCDGGEDEKQNCTTTTMSTTVTIFRTKLCKESEFECADGECVPYTKTCNSIPDCQDGSDEAGLCSTSCNNNGGCPHICHPGPVSARCECNPGFIMVDTHCWDLNECEMESTCSHHCTNLYGSFKCSCTPGYMLEPDGRTCKPESGVDMLFIVDKEEILIQSNKGQTLTREKMTERNFKQSSISSVDIDPIRGLIIMADDINGTISLHRIGMLSKTKTSLPDSEKLVIFKGLQRPNALSLDYGYGNIYFSELLIGTNRRQHRSNSQTTIMKVCSLSTSHCHDFYHGYNVTIPVSRVSVQTKKLFMCVNSMDDSAQILTSQLDGKNIEVLVNSGMVRCGDLALDEIKQRVYWSDTKLNVIEMVSFEGSGRHRIKNTMVYNPVGLGILENRLYWYNRDKREFVSCYSYDSNANNCSFIELKWEPMAIGTKSAHTYHADKEECNKLKCEQLCVPLPESSARAARCLCKTGFVWLEKEAVCVLAGTCEDHPCGQGGDCVTMGDNGYMCKCHDGFSGISCGIKKEPIKYGWGIVTLVVVLVLVFVVLICIAVLWYRRGGLQLWKKSNLASNLQFRFANPSFGLMDGRTNATQSPLPRENPFNNPAPNSVPQKNATLPNVENGFENKCFKELSEADNEVLDIPPPTSVANENLSPYQPGPNYFK